MENTVMATHLRMLPFEEWDKLEGLPISTNGLPNPDTSAILVAESDSGEVVGTWMAITPVILEGLWVKDEYRHTTVAGRLLVDMKQFLKEIGIGQAYTIVQAPYVKSLAEKAGFEMIPGDFCVLDLDKE